MSTKRIVVLTGSELRHTFFRTHLALQEGIEIVHSYCEGSERSLGSIVAASPESSPKRSMHVAAREQSEKDFFELFLKSVNDMSNPVFLPKGDINLPEHVSAIRDCAPDAIISYGCSIISGPLLQTFPKRFVNLHLGLSPYYRGSGTNFWPLVNGEPEYVGVTFMHIDAGIDTGSIIHQERAQIFHGDTPHSIGNRLIRQMVPVTARIVHAIDALQEMPQPQIPVTERYYKKKDFSEESVVELTRRFSDGLVEMYLHESDERCARVPIVTNPAITI